VIRFARPGASVLVAAVLVLIPAPAAEVRAQAPGDAPFTAEAAEAPGQMIAQPPDGAPERLSLREMPPRTLRGLVHVFAAFALTWLLVFGYVLSLGRRFARLDEEVSALSRGEAAMSPRGGG
jgi:CcmD family protein